MTDGTWQQRSGGRACLLALSLTLLALAGCHKWRAAGELHPDWIIRAQVVFLSEDLRHARVPLPLTQFRLLFPYIAGDLYGPPTTGDFLHPAIGADYRFELDLNRTQKVLLASLEPTELSLSYLRIEPSDAHIARLAPMVLQADGIEQVGRADWVDPDSKRRLLLVYADRAAGITGQTVASGRPLRYAIRIASPGYVWIARQTAVDGDVYSVVPRPARLVLAVTPTGHPTVASPARTDIPAR